MINYDDIPEDFWDDEIPELEEVEFGGVSGFNYMMDDEPETEEE